MHYSGNPLRLIRLLVENRGVPFSRVPLLLFYLAKVLFSTLLSLAETVLYSGKIERTEIKEPPLFIIGHYRSGTTLLQKLLAADHRFGHIRYLDVLCPVAGFLFERFTRRLLELYIRVFGIRNMFFNDMVLRLDDPGEEDLYMISACSGHSSAWGYMFPRAFSRYFDEWTFLDDYKKKERWKKAYLHYLKRISLKNNGKRLLLKSPPNVARISTILEMFPDARFIFIYRNPFQVYYSMQNLWRNVIERYFALTGLSDQEREEIIFDLYRRTMHRYEQDKILINKENLVELSYEELMEDPVRVSGKIYAALKISGFEHAVHGIRRRLILEEDYAANKYNYQDEILERVQKEWGYFIDQWNYHKPEEEMTRELYV